MHQGDGLGACVNVCTVKVWRKRLPWNCFLGCNACQATRDLQLCSKCKGLIEKLLAVAHRRWQGNTSCFHTLLHILVLCSTKQSKEEEKRGYLKPTHPPKIKRSLLKTRIKRFEVPEENVLDESLENSVTDIMSRQRFMKWKRKTRAHTVQQVRVP